MHTSFAYASGHPLSALGFNLPRFLLAATKRQQSKMGQYIQTQIPKSFT